MTYKEFHYQWKWSLKSSPQTIWPFMSDTNRFNYDTGIPPVKIITDDKNSLINGRRQLQLTRFGITVRYEEEPFEWSYPHRFSVVRRYANGPIAEMRVQVDLVATDSNGTNLTYQVWIKPSNLLGIPAIPLQMKFVFQAFDKAIRGYDEMAITNQCAFNLKTNRKTLAFSSHKRLEALREKLSSELPNQDLVDRLIDFIRNADDMSLNRIRPYVLADYWSLPRQKMLEVCLIATRIGLLDFRWDLLCPLCRGAKQSKAKMKDISAEVHCDGCNIDFRVNFNRFVELTFRPNSSLREINIEQFCLGGPQVTPHIITQQLLPPGDKRSIQLNLETGIHRLRTPLLQGSQSLLVTTNGLKEIDLEANESGWYENELQVDSNVYTHFINSTKKEQLFILERLAWNDQAATAADVIALQIFRDLFSEEILRPGEQFSVGSMTVVFTDLKNSTRLYREVGDAPAFGMVLNHFDVLKEAITAEGGTIIKTIGDAVMAVFRKPASAIRAMANSQHALTTPPAGMQPLKLKVGIHYGHCIAVTLNNRLDYFGSTINIAARLEGLSTGQDIIISSVVYQDPEVKELLIGSRIEPLKSMLKGFDSDEFELLRIS
jgi:class 3 adenylate cyclase